MKEETTMNKYETDLVANVNEHGWQFTFVFDDEGEEPDFGYSVGFEKTLGCPEFIIFGLPRAVMHHMLWKVFHKIKAGQIPADGGAWDGLLEGDYLCVSRLVSDTCDTSEYLNSAIWHHERSGGDPKTQKIYQLIWSGRGDKLYPWNKECSGSVIKAQPLLCDKDC